MVKGYYGYYVKIFELTSQNNFPNKFFSLDGYEQESQFILLINQINERHYAA